MNKLSLCLMAATGCSVFLSQPSERVSKFNDSELCSELADKTYNQQALINRGIK